MDRGVVPDECQENELPSSEMSVVSEPRQRLVVHWRNHPTKVSFCLVEEETSMLKRLMSVLFVMVLCGGAALAQSIYGTLLGTVKDSSGGIVPNASVVVTEQNTHISRSGATDSVGDYQLPNLLPGTYRVSMRAPGFKEFLKTDVILDSRAVVRVDGTLAPGATQTSVEVKAAPPVITTETGTVSHLETGNVLEQLPLNYRATSTSPLNAVVTVPGLNVDNGSNISIGGDNPGQNFYSVNGFSSVYLTENGPQREQFPSTEMVSEMQVATQAAPAQYSEMSAVEFATKSGTNQFHGSAFEYLQNSALNAQPDFTTTKPVFRANDFGGSLGGPVTLPHIYNGKDRTFFFVDYEGLRDSGFTGIVDNVPTQAMRQGDLSGLCSTYTAAGVCASPSGTQMTNPFTGAPLAYNIIPQSMITPASAAVLNTFYPLPNVVTSSPVNTTNNSIENGTTLFNTDMVDLRIDQNISSKQSMFGTFSYKNVPSDSPMGLLLGDSVSPIYVRSFALSHTYTIRTNMLNEFRFGYTHYNNITSQPAFPNGAQLDTQTLGLQGLGQLPSGSAIPYFEFDGASGVSNTTGGRAVFDRYWYYTLDDDVTWIRGRHTLKMGFLFDRYYLTSPITGTNSDMFGNFYFNGAFTGYDFGDFLAGLPNDVVTYSTPYVNQEYGHDFGTYVQDSIKITPKLTLNLGLRYEYHPAFYEIHGLDDNIDLQHNAAVIVPNEASLKLTTLGFEQSVNACTLPTPLPTPYGLFPCTPVVTAATYGIPRTLRFASTTDFLPRAGLAYRLNPKTVIRAGAGMYNQTLLGDIAYSDNGNHDAEFLEFTNAITNGVATYRFPQATGRAAAGVSAGTGVFGTAELEHLHDPYSSQWALTVERDLGHGTGVQLNYTGTRSVGLLVSPDVNQVKPQDKPFNPALQPYPNWSDIKFRTNGGSQSYNALELVVTHRGGGGLFFQSSYVYAKDLADDEGDNPTGFTNDESRVMNNYDLYADYGNVAFVPTSRWLTTAVWDLPIGRGKKFGASTNPILDKVIGGWQTSNILVFQTGPFLTPYYNGPNDPSGTAPENRQGAQRPDRLPASACSGLTSSQGQLFDGNCYYYGWPGQIGRFGDSGVGILTGPGTALWNFGLSKYFALGEHAKLQIQATATNFLNHPNFGLPGMAANSTSFGTISTLQNQEGAGARVVQFALRLTF